MRVQRILFLGQLLRNFNLASHHGVAFLARNSILDSLLFPIIEGKSKYIGEWKQEARKQREGVQFRKVGWIEIPKMKRQELRGMKCENGSQKERMMSFSFKLGFYFSFYDVFFGMGTNELPFELDIVFLPWNQLDWIGVLHQKLQNRHIFNWVNVQSFSRVLLIWCNSHCDQQIPCFFLPPFTLKTLSFRVFVLFVLLFLCKQQLRHSGFPLESLSRCSWNSQPSLSPCTNNTASHKRLPILCTPHNPSQFSLGLCSEPWIPFRSIAGTQKKESQVRPCYPGSWDKPHLFRMW